MEDENLDPAAEAAAQKSIVGKLYRLKDVVAGLIALAEGGSIGAGQVRGALQQIFKKMFTPQ
jgi:hypothetical protein